MTKDDIISMGEAADEYADNKLGKGEFHPDWHDVRDEWFADLVAAEPGGQGQDGHDLGG